MFSEKTTVAALPDILFKMDGSTALENPEVTYNTVTEVLVVNWEGEISSEKIRLGYDMVMKQVREHKPCKLLLDFHNRVSIRRRDQRWVFGEVFPEILRTVGDDVFVAMVLPVFFYQGLVAEMDGDDLMHQDNFLIIHHFLYCEEAYRWLENMHGKSLKG